MKKVWFLLLPLLLPLAIQAGEIDIHIGQLGSEGFTTTEQRQFNLEGVAFSWALADLGSDGLEELIVSRFGSGGPTHLSILRQDGSRIFDFTPFPKNNGPIDFCLLDKKILTATLNYPYELAIFEPTGKKISNLKWPVSSPKDISLACHKIAGQNEAVVAIGAKVFYYRTNKWVEIKASDKISGRLSLVSGDLGTDEKNELGLGNEKGEMWMWDNNYKYLKKIKTPLVFANAEAPSISQNILNEQRVWLISSPAGQDNFTIWFPQGQNLNLPAPDKTGWQIVPQASTGQTWLLPRRQKNPLYLEENKQIIVNIKNQTLTAYDRGVPIIVTKVSTGLWNLPTPIGDFKILNKKPRAYSKQYNLYMPFWMMFEPRGYGLHELPEWANGYKEGENHLGTQVSHGCIRLGVGPAQALYDWAQLGTKVKVVKE